MRIISWNMQGKPIEPNAFRKMLDEVDADVVLIQEPCKNLSLSNDEGARRSPRGSKNDTPWQLKYVEATATSGGQDRYAIAYKDPKAIEYTIALEDPTGTNGQAPGMSRQYLIAKVQIGGETLKLATCHAPYGLQKENKEDKNWSAVLYMNALIKDMESGTGHKAEKQTVDVFLGDTNVYDNQEFKFHGWEAALNSPTGGKGKSGGGSLDRVLIRKGRLAKFRSGRIYPKSHAKNVASLSSVDRRSGKVEDLAPESKEAEYWLKSDHLAIYLDSDLDRPRGGETKRRKFDDEVLVELDPKGKQVVQAKKSDKFDHTKMEQ